MVSDRCTDLHVCQNTVQHLRLQTVPKYRHHTQTVLLLLDKKNLNSESTCSVFLEHSASYHGLHQQMEVALKKSKSNQNIMTNHLNKVKKKSMNLTIYSMPSFWTWCYGHTCPALLVTVLTLLNCSSLTLKQLFSTIKHNHADSCLFNLIQIFYQISFQAFPPSDHHCIAQFLSLNKLDHIFCISGLTDRHVGLISV